MRRFIFIPILIFFIVFLFDKLFYFKFVRELFIKNNYNYYDMIYTFEDNYHDYHIENWTKKGMSRDDIYRNSLVFIGTSRSETFREYTSEDIIDNPYITDHKKILDKPVISHFMRAGTVFHTYHLFNHVINKYPNSTFAVEVNFVGLNENSYIRLKRDVEYLRWDDFKGIVEFLDLSDIWGYISSRLFVLNLYSFSPLKPFKKNNDTTPEELVKGTFVFVKQYIANSNKIKGRFVPDGIEENKESEEMLKNYELFNQNFMSTLYRKFKVRRSDVKLFENLVKIAKEKELKVIFFRPKIHKLLKNETDKLNKKEEEEYIESVRKLTSENGFPFIDLEDDKELRCGYFRDPSHLSKTCVPEIIEKFDKIYPVEISQPNK